MSDNENKNAISEKEFTCIVCPVGCRIKATLESGKPAKIEGNSCPRGAKYVTDELTHPMRVLTTTVRTDRQRTVPVRTRGAIPKELIFEAEKIISATLADDKAEPGSVLVGNILGTGVDVITTGYPV